MVPLYVSEDADHFEPIKNSIFFKIFDPKKIGSSENFVFREKVVPLFISYTVVKVRSLWDLQETIKWLITRCTITNQLKTNLGQLRGSADFSWPNEWS